MVIVTLLHLRSAVGGAVCLFAFLNSHVFTHWEVGKFNGIRMKAKKVWLADKRAHDTMLNGTSDWVLQSE